MTWIALKMLTGDRAKYVGIIAGVTFAALLIAQQASIGCGLLLRTTSTIQDIADVDIWVMDRDVRVHRRAEAADRRRPLPRPGRARRRVGRAASTRARAASSSTPAIRDGAGLYQQVIVLGLDDATLVGAPRRWSSARWPTCASRTPSSWTKTGSNICGRRNRSHAGKVFEMNDHRAVIVGVCKASRHFPDFPDPLHALSTRPCSSSRRRARSCPPSSSTRRPGLDPHDVCRRIEEQTRTRSNRPGDGQPRLKALTREEFMWMTLDYFMRRTGIIINFTITVVARLHRRLRHRRPDVLHLHAGEPEPIRLAQGDGREQPAHRRHGADPGVGRRADRLLPGRRAGGAVRRDRAALQPAGVLHAVAGAGRHRRRRSA